MPEETDDYIHIPVRDKGQFQEGSYRTITISASKGIKAVIGRLKGKTSMTVQKYLFAKAKGWTMAKAKAWVKAHKKKQVADVGKIGYDVTFTAQLEYLDGDEVLAIKELERLGIEVEEGGIYTKGTAFIEDINRNQWRTGIKNIETENYMLTPITLFNHNPDRPVGKTLHLKKTKHTLEVITQITTTDEEMKSNIKNGTINAHSIRVHPFAWEMVCLENDACFYDVLSCDLIEISYVSLNAVVGTNFEVLATSYEPIGEIQNDYNWVGSGSGGNVSVSGIPTEWSAWDNTMGWPTGDWIYVPFELDDEESKEKWTCECTKKDCNYSVKTTKHCKDLKCPKCGSQLRRSGRPGPGKEDVDEAADLDAAKWTRKFINDLPDASFAVIEPDYPSKTDNKNARHLPHHGKGGGGTKDVNLDLAHLRNALARCNQIIPVTKSISKESLRSRAKSHLEKHRGALKGNEKSKVKIMSEETPETPPTEEVEGEDLSSPVNAELEQLQSKVTELLGFKETMEKKQVELNEQSLDLRVKETMTLFEGVENKAEIEEHVTTIAKCGGEDALTATKAILKSVMESKVIVDSSLTPRGGDGLSTEDELSKADFGKTVDEMVAEITDKPIVHEIKVEG